MEYKQDFRQHLWNPPKLIDLTLAPRCPAFINVRTLEVSKQVANEHISILRDPQRAFSTRDSPSSSPILGNASDAYLRLVSKHCNTLQTSNNFSFSAEDADNQRLSLQKRFAKWILHIEPPVSRAEEEEMTKFPPQENIHELNRRFDNLVKSCLVELQKKGFEKDVPQDDFEDKSNPHGASEDYQVSPSRYSQFGELREFRGSLDPSHFDGLRSNSVNQSNFGKTESILPYTSDQLAYAIQSAARTQDYERAMKAVQVKMDQNNHQFLKSEEHYIKFTSVICSLLVKYKLKGYIWQEESLSMHRKCHDSDEKSLREEVRFVGFLRNHFECRKGSERFLYDRVVTRLLREGIYNYFFSQPESHYWTSHEILHDIALVIEEKMELDIEAINDDEMSSIDVTAFQIEDELDDWSQNLISRDEFLDLVVEATTKVEVEELQNNLEFEVAD